ncbi:MAG: DUF1553 domain-containing protein [Pirellulaceae bacterium]|nr:DUF1553 domain-containing protein [Pirellulaceae bacterium]
MKRHAKSSYELCLKTWRIFAKRKGTLFWTLLSDRRQENARSQALAWERTALEAPPRVPFVTTLEHLSCLQAEPALQWVPRRSLGTRCWSSARSGFFCYLAFAGSSFGAEKTIDFNRDVRPILSENCFACHGFDEKSREADLRLDLMDTAYADRDGTTAISPGKLDRSEVWNRISSDDEDEIMPPATSHLTLTDRQKGILKAWIEQGAPYAGHWSFIPPRKVDVPGTAKLNPIDAFVQQRLNEEELQLSERADRSMLIRRISFDLTGLPPTAEEVQAFVDDESNEAYVKLVDRLLQSPHFGERLAVEWLDSARYADTNGFSIDGGRHLWLWRDWVIQSFNDNLPYDQFLVDQLAGDLLPNRTESQLIATGFQRNNMVTHEGGTIPEENLTNYNADRVKTLGESVLGLTIGCAQCHDHKFDPITQREYYQMFAFFNSLSDKGLDGNGGVNPGPSIEAKTVLRTDEVESLRQQIANIQAELGRKDAKILAAWESREHANLAQRGQDLVVHPLEILKISTPNRGAGFEVENKNFARLSDAGAMGAFDFSTELPDLNLPITGIRVVVHPVAEFPGGGWGNGPSLRPKPRAKVIKPKAATVANSPIKRSADAESDKSLEEVEKSLEEVDKSLEEVEKSLEEVDKSLEEDAETVKATVASDEPRKGSFMLTAIAATVDRIPGDQVNLFELLSFNRVTASSWEPEHRPSDCLDPRNESGWSPDLATEGPVHLTATLSKPIRVPESKYLTIQLNFGNGKNLVPELVELQVITGNDDGTDLPSSIVSILTTSPLERTSEMQSQFWNYCSQHATELDAKRVELANLQERLAVLTQSFMTMVMDVAAKPRDTFVLHRGDYSQPLDKVSPGTPSSLPPLQTDATLDRLALARWLTMPNHPLTARVAVNRFWKMLFGTGFVATAADFGSQGEWPSHLDLLDWLAVDFVESGWNVKAIVRKIVMSETYQQTSASSAELLERDPQNRLLARGSRFRLSAEFIRDAALKTSGLLVPRIGGPSVNPYMPGDLWREVSHYGSSPATAQTFVQDHGEKLYRRSMYTFWKRTAPPPNMTAFDAPNREICTITRSSTTTPLQALVTLNDPQFVEASRAFAQRIVSHVKSEGDANVDNARVHWAFLEATSRKPAKNEIDILLKTLERERSRYTSQLNSAKAYLSVGETPVDDSIAASELAAWSQVAVILLNLSETVTRN